jgi:hypothetical protein
MRLRLTAHSLSDLRAPLGAAEATGSPLARLADELADWYQNLASHLGRANDPATLVPLSQPPSDDEFVAPLAATAGSARTGLRGRLTTALWVGNHLSHLHLHHVDVIEPAAKVAEQRQRPWWR